MSKQVSIKDVALHAGTSIATVSRILNDVGYPISETLRSRVETAIRELGYRPNRMAQNLRSKQTQSIGLVVRDISDSYFGAIAQGVTEEASTRGLMSLVCSSKRNPKLEIEYMRLLAQYQVAGVIIAGAGWVDEDFRARLKRTVQDLNKQGVRVISCAPQEVAMPCATVDNSAIGREACRLLSELGHTTFGVLSGDDINYSNLLRVEGFAEAAGAAGAAWFKSTGAFSWQHGYTAVRELLTDHPDITAFFATNDNIAVGALRGLEEMGKRVPDQISVLGVGDIAMAEYTSPALSTFRLPFYDFGATAVKMIFDGHLREDTLVPFSGNYIRRESVGVRKK